MGTSWSKELSLYKVEFRGWKDISLGALAPFFVVIFTDWILFIYGFNKNELKESMSIIAFMKKKISKLKNRFNVKKVPMMMPKNLETIAYLKKI